jgi:hypothetical protein
VTTDEFRDRLAGVREGLDSVLDSLNDLEERTWDEIDQGAVVLSLIRGPGRARGLSIPRARVAQYVVDRARVQAELP